MKYLTQYQDLVGKAAVDFRDDKEKLYSTLAEIAEELGLDTDKYQPVGLRMYISYNDEPPSVFILSKVQDSSEAIQGLISHSVEISKDNFFSLFKRFDLILTISEELLQLEVEQH